MSHRLALAGLFALALSACSAPAVYVTPRVAQIGISGDIGIQQGSNLDAKASIDSLDIDDDSSVLGGRVDLLALGHWTFSAQQSSHSGEGTADAQLSDGTVTISAGDPVKSEIDFGVYSGAWTFDLVPGDTIEVGLGLGVTVLDVNAHFTDQATSGTIKSDELVPVPNLVGRLGANLGPVELSGLVSWIDLGYRDTDASYLDVDAMARVRIFGDSNRFSGHIAAGYRFMDVKANYEDSGNSVGVDVEFSGPWIGLSVSF